MFLDEASRRWADMPITLHATGIGTTKTKVMTSPDIHWIMRLMAKFGTTPEKSARNAIALLLNSATPSPAKGLLKKPGEFSISPFDTPQMKRLDCGTSPQTLPDSTGWNCPEGRNREALTCE